MKREVWQKKMRYCIAYFIYIIVLGLVDLIAVKTGWKPSFMDMLFKLSLIVMYVVFMIINWRLIRFIKVSALRWVALVLLSALMTGVLGFITLFIIVNFHFAIGGTE